MSRAGANGRHGDRPASRLCPTCGAPNPVGAGRCADVRAARSPNRPLRPPVGRRAGVGDRRAGDARSSTAIRRPICRRRLRHRPTRPALRRRDQFRPATARRPVARRARRYAPAPAKQRGGPPGFLLGCLALLIIGAVGAAFLWTAVRPYVGDRVEAEITTGIEAELDGIDRVPVRSSGQIVVTEAQVNRALARNGERYEPFSDPEIAIGPEEIRVDVDLYGTTSTFRGGLDVADGRIVVVDPDDRRPGGAARRRRHDRRDVGSRTRRPPRPRRPPPDRRAPARRFDRDRARRPAA